MPIKIPNTLPAAKTLAEENIFVMTETRALTQDIRPLKILILNLMPTKIATETQLARLLGNTPLQVEIELIRTASHESNTGRSSARFSSGQKPMSTQLSTSVGAPRRASTTTSA